MKRIASLAGFAVLLTPLWLGASDCEVAVVDGSDGDDKDPDAGPGGDGDTGDGDTGASCMYEGTLHKAGESFPDRDGCNTCSCGEDGSVACTERACAPGCEFNSEMHFAGERWTVGCNTCECTADGKVACTDQACGGMGCTFGGKHYEVGDTFPNDCNVCACGEDGLVSCTAQACPEPGTCTLGSTAFKEGDGVICPDGCNQCGCHDGGWSSTDAACSPLPGIEVCPQDMSTQLAPLYLDGDALALDVTYSGGCEEHEFKLCYNGSFQESSPVQATLYVIDLTKTDPCEATPSKPKVFSLAPLRAAYQKAYQTDKGTVNLRIGSETVPYVFSAAP